VHKLGREADPTDLQDESNTCSPHEVELKAVGQSCAIALEDEVMTPIVGFIPQDDLAPSPG
jgi:hypothetical protein